MAKLTHLPRPHPVFNRYDLPDGSRIYASGHHTRPIRPGKWFVWLYQGEEAYPDGSKRASGRILLLPGTIAYFDSAEEALKAVRRQRGTGVLRD